MLADRRSPHGTVPGAKAAHLHTNAADASMHSTSTTFPAQIRPSPPIDGPQPHSNGSRHDLALPILCACLLNFSPDLVFQSMTFGWQPFSLARPPIPFLARTFPPANPSLPTAPGCLIHAPFFWRMGGRVGNSTGSRRVRAAQLAAPSQGRVPQVSILRPGAPGLDSETWETTAPSQP